MQRYAMVYDPKEDMDEILPSDLGGWIRYDDAQAEIARLTAALETAQADLAWMQNDRNKWQDSATQRYYRAEKAEAERDAIAAAAFEAAEQWMIRAGMAGDGQGDPLADCIRALTPADATAALARIKAQERAAGMREAAGICTRGDDRSAILARADAVERGE